MHLPTVSEKRPEGVRHPTMGCGAGQTGCKRGASGVQAGCGGERGWGGREEGVREGKSEIDVVEEEGCERKVGGVGSGGGEMWGALVWG